MILRITASDLWNKRKQIPLTATTCIYDLHVAGMSVPWMPQPLAGTLLEEALRATTELDAYRCAREWLAAQGFPHADPDNVDVTLQWPDVQPQPWTVLATVSDDPRIPTKIPKLEEEGQP